MADFHRCGAQGIRVAPGYGVLGLLFRKCPCRGQAHAAVAADDDSDFPSEPIPRNVPSNEALAPLQSRAHYEQQEGTVAEQGVLLVLALPVSRRADPRRVR
jgi:hypothetical protein